MKNNKFKRGIVGSMLALMLVTATFPAPKAQAATLQELQAQIQALIAQIQALGGSVPTGVISGSCSTTFQSDLTIGRTGSEVTALQNFLINKGFAIPAGATGYFGGQTQSALAKFQAANGIVPAVGYFGPITRSKVNAMCTVVVPPANNNGGNNNGNNNSGNNQPSLSGQAEFFRFDVKSGDDSNLEEGDSNMSVMEVEFEVRDGDLRVNRIDLAFTPDGGNNETDPWDTFEEVSLYHDGDRIARVDASRESSWREDTPNNGDYRLRFSGLSWLIEEDEEVMLEVRVDVQNSVKGTNDGEVWTIFVLDDGIRALDADRASIYTGNDADGVTIDIDQAGGSDELIVKRSNDDPNATVLQLEDNGNSDWLTVFVFDLDTDDSTNDIEIRELPIQLTVDSSTVGTFMRDIRLVVDGEVYADKNITDGSTNTVVFDIDRDEFVIDSGDRVTVEVQVEFKALASAYEGTTIYGSVNTSAIEARGADTLSGSQLSGSATGDTHTMRTQGVNLVEKSMSASLERNSDNTTEDDQGKYSIEFEVTAFNSDVYVPKTTERGTVLGSAGVNYVIEDSSNNGMAVASGTANAVLTANAESQGSYFVVREGQTKTFKLFVNYDSEYTSFYNLQLHSINWSNSAIAPQTQQLASPSQDYETDVVIVRN